MADHNDNIPACISAWLIGDAVVSKWDSRDLREVVHCRKCDSRVDLCQEAINYKPGRCLLLHCGDRQKNQCPNWFACLSCLKRIDKRRVKSHFDSHGATRQEDATNANHHQNSSKGITTNGDNNKKVSKKSTANLLDGWTPEQIKFCLSDTNCEEDQMDVQEDALSVQDDSLSDSGQSAQRQQCNPLLDLSSTDPAEWIERAFSSQRKAFDWEVMESFGDQTKMKLFHFAEFLGDGCGIQYLVGRAFARTEHLLAEKVPTKKESTWHIRSFIQYQTMTQKQRKRQTQLINTLVTNSDDKGLFSCTWVPRNAPEVSQLYFRSNAHSMLNTLPIPTVENYNGIGYVSPINILRFMFACGVEVDDFCFNGADDVISGNEKMVVHVTDSAAAKEISNYARENNGFGKNPLILLWNSDWLDGFGANRTKQNRNPMRLWILASGPPKDKVNSTDNTLPVAVGMKKNSFWPQVERRFRDDMESLCDKPIELYHGPSRKIVPVLLKRIASLTDKVERADVTGTLSCVSDYHRLFGKVVKFERPTIDTLVLEMFLSVQQSGDGDDTLKDLGWASQMVDTSKNTGYLPSCDSCRKKCLLAIRRLSAKTPAAIDDETDNVCGLCANWTLSDTTKDRLSFSPGKDYPARVRPDCPIDAPMGRAIGAAKLEYVDLTFEFMKHAARFAYFHSMGPKGQQWTKAHCKAYLRACGIKTSLQEALYDDARKSYSEKLPVDYAQEDGIGNFFFPASWNGAVPIPRFIEMLMHLLFLGVAESNFTLSLDYLKSIGERENTFKIRMQPLLHRLRQFNLSWLLVHPFSGKDPLTTGPWVSENWLAWVRLSKVNSAYFCRHGLASERLGSNDLVRVVVSFTALVARVLTHSGVNKNTVAAVNLFTKEFLSSVRELDLRSRYKELAIMSGKNLKESWWLKSNYISLLNLTGAMEALGPLKNFWDGGGKGERYIQKVKPHVPLGIRDGGNFMVRLLQAVYNEFIMDYLDGLIDITENGYYNKKNRREQRTVTTETISAGSSSYSDEESSDESEPSLPSSVNGGNNDDDSASKNSTNTQATQSTVESTAEEWEDWLDYSPMEDDEMKKARVIYIYRSKNELQQSINRSEPIAGIIIRNEAVSGNPEMFAVYKMPGKRFGWMQILFQDDQGVQHVGTWFAPLLAHEPITSPPQSIDEIKVQAKMASMAIPLRYSFEEGHPDRLKYCVITNWWRERNDKGRYMLPTIDFSYYSNLN